MSHIKGLLYMYLSPFIYIPTKKKNYALLFRTSVQNATVVFDRNQTILSEVRKHSWMSYFAAPTNEGRR